MKKRNKKRLDKIKFLWHGQLQQRKIENVILKNEKYGLLGSAEKIFKKC